MTNFSSRRLHSHPCRSLFSSSDRVGINTRSSPHLALLRRRTHHRRVSFTCERLLELRQVTQRSDHAILRNRMRVALHHQALRLRTYLIAAELSPGDKELLFGCEAIDGRV